MVNDVDMNNKPESEKVEAEKIVKFFVETQTCPDKRVAFIKGVLYGLGFAQVKEPNWEIIKKIIQEGDDPVHWVDIEKSVFDVHKKIYKEHVKMWQLKYDDTIIEHQMK